MLELLAIMFEFMGFGISGSDPRPPYTPPLPVINCDFSHLGC